MPELSGMPGVVRGLIIMMGILRKIALAIVIGALVVSCTQMGGADPRVGSVAPDISLKSIDGTSSKLSDLKGKVVVLDFWATWCPPCRASLPNLARLSTDPALAARGLKVIAVNCKEDAQTVRSFLATNKLELTASLDTDGSAEDAYKVDGIPSTFVIGRDGTIQHTIVGFNAGETEKELNDAVEKALSK
jgi:thiol-disulfide isomerase/thioredoxin